MSYLSRFLSPTYAKETVDDVVKALQHEAPGFDSIAIRGVSGGLIGPAVAMALNKQILVIRKGEENHSQALVEMRDYPRRYIIIDDLIDSGKTVWSIVDTIREVVGTEAMCLGAYFYAQQGRSLEWIKGTYIKALPPLYSITSRATERLQLGVRHDTDEISF